MKLSSIDMWSTRIPLSMFFILLLQAQLVIYVMSQAPCRDNGAVRLLGSANMTEGRLEICVGELWGTVCNDGFDINAAQVVCRQLGFQEHVLPKVVSNIFFGGGGSFQPIHLDDLSCTGNEENLLNCTYGDIGVHNCDHLEDVGIICKPSQDCRDGDVRLVDGDNYNATAGRVEYCVGGLWGTVCDSRWGDVDAKVVCRQLGFNATEPKALERNDVPRVKNPQTPIVLTGLNCQGTETSVGSCSREQVVEYCAHSDYVHGSDAGANCTNIKECNDGDVRLYNFDGDSKNEGRVEYCSLGRWILVCNDHWDNDDATVVCRQLGYNVNDGSAVAKSASISGNSLTSRFLGRVDCVGTENNISECTQRSSRCIILGAGAICPMHNASLCTDGDVRLQGGSLSNEIGHVEVCISGQWGLVCDDEWDDIDASVVCRQLGYTDGVATHMSTFGSSTNRVYVIDRVNCTGNESTILDCQRPKNTRCYARLEEAGAICRNTADDKELCADEYINKTVSIIGSNATNLTAGSIGTCQRYLGQSNLCNNFYKSTDYIFTAMNQTVLSMELDDRVLPILSGDNVECRELISKVVCHYFFAPCGENGLLHLPLSVCHEECHYVESTCASEWIVINNLLSNAQLSPIDCNSTSTLLKHLDPCCIDAEIDMKNATTKTPVVPPVGSLKTDTTTAGIVIGILVAFLIVLVGVVAVTIGLAAMVIKRRKTTIRSLQLEVLTSPTRTSIEPLTANFMKNLDDIEFGADVKLRGNRTNSLPHADPNPYSTKQELALASPLLSPTDNKMMNRISSSIIRELSSNMLIPYTRLKLMECVGQGEFGVVYKAQHTEPDGDIGYKTSTVAVKTLKGFFDNSQVNKIMEESIKMKHFDHPNVLHLIGVCLDAGPAPYVVMPFMANGSLLHYLKKERNNIVLQVGGDEDVKIDVRKRLTVMCLQIASGMEYLAGEKFVHRDLAARNCMIDIHFVIKIADFGLSEDIYSKNYFRQSGSDKSVKLPVKWMAPESLTDGVFSEKSDVWSFGVTCWEVFSGGKTPYPGVDPLLLSRLLETGQRLDKPLNSACPDELYTLMMNCWDKLPDKRPSFSDVVTSISNYTEVIAGYLDINFNPFESTSSGVSNAAAAISITTVPDPDPYVTTKDKLGSTELLSESNKVKTKSNNKKSKSPKDSPKVSPNTSRKPSPKTSPRISPRASPLFKLRKFKDDHQILSTTKSAPKSTAGIEIRIESPL